MFSMSILHYKYSDTIGKNHVTGISPFRPFWARAAAPVKLHAAGP